MEEKRGNGFSEILEKLLAHPESLLGIVSLLQGAKESGQTEAQAEEKDQEAFFSFAAEEQEGEKELPSEMETVREAVDPPKASAKGKRKRDILCAIRPYAHGKKQAQIDRILHAAELVALLKETQEG